MNIKSFGWPLLIIGGLLLFFAIYPANAGEYELLFVYYGSQAINLGGALVFVAIIIFVAAKS